jgi:hypothetical protein
LEDDGGRVEVVKVLGRTLDDGGDPDPAHDPKPTRHPVPQYALVLPQYPCCEQHNPVVQTKFLLFGPHLSVEVPATALEVGVGTEERRDDDAPLQVPKLAWQPVLQYESVIPHHPYCEQHFPDLHF